MPFRFTLKRWRRPIFWTVVGLVLLEFPLTISTLALFGIADPDTYRTKLWLDGFNNGFNSDPASQLYAAANHQPALKIPIIWSGFMTKYDLVISLLSMFILLLKAVLVPMHVLFPIVSILIHAVEIGLWSYSVYGQTSHDTIDPRHQVNGPPWYITKNCDVAFKRENIGFCKQAKASFYVACVMLALFAVHVLIAVASMFLAPAPLSDEERRATGRFRLSGRFSKSDEVGKEHFDEPERQWEMVRIPDTPGTTGGIKSPLPPMTPRTKAFNALDGGYTAHGGVEKKPLAPWGGKRQEKMPWSDR